MKSNKLIGFHYGSSEKFGFNKGKFIINPIIEFNKANDNLLIIKKPIEKIKNTITEQEKIEIKGDTDILSIIENNLKKFEEKYSLDKSEESKAYKQALSYFVFQYKFKLLLEKGINKLFINDEEIKCYVIDTDWIKKWKLYLNYDEIIKYADKDYDYLINNKIIKIKSEHYPSNFNGNGIYGFYKKEMKLEDFKCIIDKNIYELFRNEFENFFFYRINTIISFCFVMKNLENIILLKDFVENNDKFFLSKIISNFPNILAVDIIVLFKENLNNEMKTMKINGEDIITGNISFH